MKATSLSSLPPTLMLSLWTALTLFTQTITFTHAFGTSSYKTTHSFLPPSLTSTSRSPTIKLNSLPENSATLALNVARNVRPSVFLITSRSFRNSSGSAFVIGFNDTSAEYTYFLTAAHVAVPGIDLTVESNGDSLPVTVIGRNVDHDLALIRTQRVEARELELTSDLPEVGTIAFAHGFVSRIRDSVMTSGIVCGISDGIFGSGEGEGTPAALSNVTDDATYVVTDAAMASGMSGGPLVDSSGVVMGVNALIRPDLRALGNYAVSAIDVRSFLESVSSKMDNEVEIGSYQVVLLNDRMNKKERVASVLQTVAKMNDDDANDVMMKAHTTGRGVVGEYSQMTDAEDMCKALRKERILVEVEPIIKE